jgi:hypothetical protein
MAAGPGEVTVTEGLNQSVEAGWRPNRAPGIEERTAGSDLVLYDSTGGRLHVLNLTAAAVWRLCDGSKTVDDILEQVGVKFAFNDGDQPRSDIKGLLGNLREQGLIVK